MRTFEIITNLKTGEIYDMGNGPVGFCKIRRTKKGAIVSNSKGNFYVKEKDFEYAIGNQNNIGLQNELYTFR